MAEILKDLNAKKAKQENDIPIKLITENIVIFFCSVYNVKLLYWQNLFSK